MKTEDIRRFLSENPPKTGESGYYARVARKFHTTAEYVRQVAKKTGTRGIRANVQSKRTASDLPEAIYGLLHKSKKGWSQIELSNHFDVGVGRVAEAIKTLNDEGKNIRLREDKLEVSSEIPHSKPTIIDTKKFASRHFKIGVTGDNHLCSNYERLDVLNALFDIWEKQGVTDVYQAGNMIDGEARFNKFDIHVYGLQNQVNYFVKHWPQRKGITTHFATGDDHEGWYTQREGINVGKLIELTAKDAGRTDLHFLGHMEHDLVLKMPKGQSIMRVIHAGGGSSYATSYSVQKIVESYQGGEKPQILLVGHYHKAEYGYPREVHVVQVGCTVDQTPFMRKNKIQGHLGGWTVDFDQDDHGIIHAFQPQFHPFYDKGFYDKAWKYEWR